MSDISTQFEFHLKGAAAREGELDADHLLAIVSSLQDVATKIGRIETSAEPVGRAPKRVHRVAKLMIGLAPGSTTILARRVGAGEGALDFDLPEERAFDESFQALVESIADDQRPGWVGDSLSLAAEDLTGALQQAAPKIEFRADGQVRRSFRAEDVSRQTWRVAGLTDRESITFTGRLYAANLKTHRFQVEDDIGNQLGLPGVNDDAQVARLLDSYVIVTGAPVVDAGGRLRHIRSATVEAAPDLVGASRSRAAVPLDEIVASAPGPDPDAGIDMSDDEWDQLWAALHR